MPTVLLEAFLVRGRFGQRMTMVLRSFDSLEGFVVQGMAHIVAAACPRPREESRSPRAGQAGGTPPGTAQEGAARGHGISGSRGAHAPAQQGHTGRPHAGLGAASAQSA